MYSAAKSKLGDSMSGSNLIPFLQDYSLSDSQKGEYISQFTNISDKLQPLADNGDYEKVYQYYNIKYSADKPGKGYGNLSQEELKSYFAQSNLSQEEKHTWFSIFFPNAKTNPY